MKARNTVLSAGLAATLLSGAALGSVGATGSAYPSPAIPGSPVITMVHVIPSVDPPSNGIIVVEDLAPFGLGAQQMFDDGLNGDAVGGDNIFTLKFLLPITTAPGDYDITFKASDDMDNSVSGVFKLMVGAPPCSADFNGDGDVGTDQDIFDFFTCLGGYCCETCGSLDINGDGDVGTDADIEAFFRILGGGGC
jgi:hypothetical protein